MYDDKTRNRNYTFRNNNPDKGTETLWKAIALPEPVNTFRNNNPDKGTETPL